MTDAVGEFISARATHRLVNRKGELDALYKAIFGPVGAAKVVLITAPAGMGKTFLLRKVLERCREGGEWYQPNRVIVPPQAGRDLVDLYHSRTHSIEGFLREAWEVLGGPEAGMDEFAAALQRFEQERFHLAELHRELSRARDWLISAFLEDVNRLTADKRLVLAVDTAEKLFYKAGPVEESLQLGAEESAILPWLTDAFLGKAQNVVILLAGRPEPHVLQLKTKLQDTFGNQFAHVDFGNLDERSAVDYFDAVAEAVRKDGYIRTAEMIAKIPEETRRVIYMYTGGQPILLSLMIDHLIVADRLLPEVTVSLDEAQALQNKEGLDAIRTKIEKSLVQGFQERSAEQADVIRLLAWARKGLSADMFARIQGISQEEVSAQLRGIQELSFVKHLGDRYFLHDALYEMFERHLSGPARGPTRDSVYTAILNYYAEAISNARDSLKAAFEVPLKDRGKAVGEAHARLARLLGEEMYYRWLVSPESGFQQWEEYHREMYWVNDTATQMELDDEVRAFLKEPANQGKDKFNGLTAAEVERTMLLHRLQRMLLRGEYERLAEVCSKASDQFRRLPEPSRDLVAAQLAILHAEALASRGASLSLSEGLLKDAMTSLGGLGKLSPFDQRRRDVALAQAWNNLGYLYRTMGRYQEAIEAYQRSAGFWRRLEDDEKEPTLRFPLRAQYANTLNNLSLALAWTGQFQQALRVCNDALEMRRGLGPDGPVAYSLNTLGLIHTKADQPELAEYACREALEIFTRLDQRRGIGLALTALSEAMRRKAERRSAIFSPKERKDWLEKAIEHAERAAEIFEKEIREDAQRAQALIELGCAHRDLVRLLKNGNGEGEWQKHANLGEDALNKAKEAACDESLNYLGVDALVNLAWLYHYAGRDQDAEKTAKEAKGKIPAEFYITEQGIPPEREKLLQAFLFVQLGKIEMLLGEIALHEGNLEAAGEHLALSLAYDELYATDFRDMRRGMDRMYALLKTLGADKMGSVRKGIDKAAETYRLKKPTRMHQFLKDSFGVQDAGGAL
ncbi:MAG: tetratricopeptide repeat protein [Anaerolineae bacterium]